MTTDSEPTSDGQAAPEQADHAADTEMAGAPVVEIVAEPEAILRFAELLGELAADLWLDGKLDVD